jgi:hypothetical protein
LAHLVLRNNCGLVSKVEFNRHINRHRLEEAQKLREAGLTQG